MLAEQRMRCRAVALRTVWAMLLAVAALTFAHAAVAQDRETSFDLTGQPLNALLSLYFKEVYQRPYVLCDAVLTDARLVSVRAAGDVLDAAAMDALLDAYGYEAVDRSGVVTVCKKVERDRPAAASTPFVYAPRYRATSYLVDLLAPMFEGTFANRRASTRGALSVGGGDAPVAAGPASSYAASDRDDLLIYSGSEGDIRRLQAVLEQVDTPAGEVVVKAHLYEVGGSARQTAAVNAVSLLGDFFKGTFEVSLSGTGGLAIRGPNLTAIANLIDTDGRFKLVSTPSARVRSGASARFQVGDEVPVLGAIVSAQDGSTRQSVEYRPSGTIFQVSPQVRGELVDLDVFQQVSSFVATENGVNGSPTLQTRELRTSLSVRDGELIVIGGLNENRDTATRSRMPFLGLPLGRGADQRQSELVMILEVTRI